MDRRDGPRPVVVGVDCSEQALRAVWWGAAVAACRQMPLRLVNPFVGSSGLLLGSVGNAPAHRADCPVAVVRTAEGGDHDAS